MTIIIDSSHDINEEQVRELIEVCHEENYLLGILKSNKLICKHIAYIEGKLVGLIMAWKNDFHPYCTYFRLLTNPLYNSSEIESKLYARLGKQNLPLQTSIWETATNLKQFYESRGFIEIRRTYMPVLKVDAVHEDLWIVENRSIKTLKAVLVNPPLKTKLLQFVRKTYKETHLDNPVAEKSLEEWENLLLDDVLVDGSFIYLDTFEFGWSGSVRFDFLQCLLIKQIHYAKERNVQFLQGEFDTTSPYAMFSLRILPFDPCPTWVTYQNKFNDRNEGETFWSNMKMKLLKFSKAPYI
ncbi:GNAT family acetyltransferase [Psychrobacillus sp. NPDC096426]|uniref:GNAT family acetyltransferase n=1 Tax=Psychrobacillus sp. NPDC096426 TaxID=3364491 RepID=UPI0037FDE654